MLKEGKSFEEMKQELTLRPIAEDLSEILGMDVAFAEDSIGLDYVKINIPDADIVLLENVQFHKGEAKNDEEYARKLAGIADIYVNDGFAQCHREYASFCAITKFLPSCAGFLVEKELKELSKLIYPEKPFIAIVAGAKEDKIGALKALTIKADKILIGGVLANTFLKAKGIDIGASKFDNETFNVAQELIQMAGKKLVLPDDFVVADKCDNNADTQIVSADSIPPGQMALDIGPVTIGHYKQELKDAKTVFWAGPLGVFEMSKFSAGTKDIGEFIGSLDCNKIVGGGDTGAAINLFKLSDKMTHVSTGGGASLEFIEKEGRLPALVALEDAYKKQNQ
jgi:phosphoglycerate kinase